MNILGFLASVIKSLAWPVLIYILVMIFKDNIRGLIDRTKRARFGNLEAEFEALQDVLPKGVVDDLNNEFIQKTDSDILEIAERAPRAAVITSWGELESLLRQFAKTNNLLGSYEVFSADNLVETIEKSNVLSQAYIPGIRALLRIRNEVAHSDSNVVPSIESVIGYLKASRAIQYYVKSVLFE